MNTAHALLQKLRQNYVAELPDRLDAMEALVLTLENRGLADEVHSELFRQVHSLKGSGGTHGIHILTSICHPFEDYLSTVSGRDNLHEPGFANIALAFIDLLREVAVRLTQKKETFADIEDSLAALRLRSFAPRYSALLVENSSVVVNILKKILQKFNFRVNVLDDGYAALGRALVEPCDLLISAQEVRLLNGTALIGALKQAHGLNARAKSILLTSNPERGMRGARPDFVICKDDRLNDNVTAAITSVVAELEAVGRA